MVACARWRARRAQERVGKGDAPHSLPSLPPPRPPRRPRHTLHRPTCPSSALAAWAKGPCASWSGYARRWGAGRGGRGAPSTPASALAGLRCGQRARRAPGARRGDRVWCGGCAHVARRHGPLPSPAPPARPLCPHRVPRLLLPRLAPGVFRRRRAHVPARAAARRARRVENRGRRVCHGPSVCPVRRRPGQSVRAVGGIGEEKRRKKPAHPLLFSSPSRYDAFYSTTNPHAQITAWVFDSVRATCPTLTVRRGEEGARARRARGGPLPTQPPRQLDAVFLRKDVIASAVKNELEKAMSGFGFKILQALIPDITPGGRAGRAGRARPPPALARPRPHLHPARGVGPGGHERDSGAATPASSRARESGGQQDPVGHRSRGGSGSQVPPRARHRAPAAGDRRGVAGERQRVWRAGGRCQLAGRPVPHAHDAVAGHDAGGEREGRGFEGGKYGRRRSARSETFSSPPSISSRSAPPRAPTPFSCRTRPPRLAT